MAREERVFRPATVRRLRAPDELDELPRFTPPQGWLALLAAAAVAAAAAAWALAGA